MFSKFAAVLVFSDIASGSSLKRNGEDLNPMGGKLKAARQAGIHGFPRTDSAVPVEEDAVAVQQFPSTVEAADELDLDAAFEQDLAEEVRKAVVHSFDGTVERGITKKIREMIADVRGSQSVAELDAELQKIAANEKEWDDAIQAASSGDGAEKDAARAKLTDLLAREVHD